VKLLLLLLLVAILVAGCGGGTPTTQTRSVGSFDRLEVDGDINVDVVPGDGGDIEVTAGEKVIDRVVTEASGGVLHVRIRDRGIVIGPDPFHDVRVQVAAASLDGIRVEGSSDLKLGRIDRDELSIEVNGSGDIEASGTVGNLIATIEGAGDAHLFDLEAKTATVTVQGAGDAELNVTDKLDITVQGAGDIRYRGNPSIRQTVEGAGDIRPAD
jgi:Putative auto-transporter adhesin, head GIN domain